MTKAEAIAMLKRIQEPEAWEPQINQAAFEALDMAIEALSQESSEDAVSRQAAIDALKEEEYPCESDYDEGYMAALDKAVWIVEKWLPSAQPEIIRCKDCEYGEQDEVGRWFCRSLGCQIGNEDGSGYCADAERRTDDKTNKGSSC